MDRVGGYLSYVALCEDARAYADVVLAMRGEYDAIEDRKLQQQMDAAVTAQGLG